MNIAAFPALALAALLIPSGASGAAAPGQIAKHPHNSVTCSGAGTNSFIGVNDANQAFGLDTAVLAGYENVACDDYSAVGAGFENTASSGGNDTALYAFVGGGNLITVSNESAFAGGGLNQLSAGYAGAIGGGLANEVSSGSDDGVVGAGEGNYVASAQSAGIGAGQYNEILYENGNPLPSNGAFWSVIAGGYKNTIQPAGGGSAQAQPAQYAFLGGGSQNNVNGSYAVVGGGSENLASGEFATVPGGYHNIASGTAAFAAGYAAYAVTNGSFVWSDYSPSAPHPAATKPNQFLARATGGVAFYSNAAMSAGVALAPGSGTWSSLSDRRMKDHITSLNGASILEKLAAVPVSEWSYTSEEGVRHIGPMAQDFYTAFKVGEDDRHIATVDEDGVTLAAVKALHAESRAQAAREDAATGELRRELDALRRTVAALRRH